MEFAETMEQHGALQEITALGTNGALREHSYSDSKRASILEAFFESYSQVATLSPIVNTLPMGAPPVSSPVIELRSPTVAGVDTLICGGSEATFSGRQLFSPPAAHQPPITLCSTARCPGFFSCSQVVKLPQSFERFFH